MSPARSSQVPEYARFSVAAEQGILDAELAAASIRCCSASAQRASEMS